MVAAKKDNICLKERVARSVCAPEIGSVFTAYAVGPKIEGRDLRIEAIPNFTGYVKRNSKYYPGEVMPGEHYRFVIVDVGFKGHHNYYYAIPFRKIGEDESRDFNWLIPQDFLKIKRIAECFLGIRKSVSQE